jgi:hypothetical protein
MAKGSFWWWVLPLAPGVPEILIVGREREYLNWFYQGPSGATHEAISPESVTEYLRTFSGKEGVLGAEGVYRAAFTTIAQTAPLQDRKVKVPVVAMGGERGLGASVGQFLSMVASEVTSLLLPVAATSFPKSAPTRWSTRCCGSRPCQDEIAKALRHPFRN